MTGSQSLFVPIHNLVLSDSLNGELSLGRVTFVSSKRIPWIRRRLGLPRPISYYAMAFSQRFNRSLLSTHTYAHLRTRIGFAEDLTSEFEVIEQAVLLLASAQFYRSRRLYTIRFGGPQYSAAQRDHYLLFSNQDDRATSTAVRLDPLEPYTLDRSALDPSHFFPWLLRIIQARVQVDPDWRNDITTAAIFAGRSVFTTDLTQALLLDIVALERLLTRRGEKVVPAMVSRATSLLGWITNDSPEPWQRLIRRLYELRSAYVHKGHATGLTARDLIAADALLANILRNICATTRHIKSKSELIALSEKLTARRVLGLRLSGRPRNLAYNRQYMSDANYTEIERRRHWQG